MHIHWSAGDGDIAVVIAELPQVHQVTGSEALAKVSLVFGSERIAESSSEDCTKVIAELEIMHARGGGTTSEPRTNAHYHPK